MTRTSSPGTPVVLGFTILNCGIPAADLTFGAADPAKRTNRNTVKRFIVQKRDGPRELEGAERDGVFISRSSKQQIV
jgi:hypothetical protein